MLTDRKARTRYNKRLREIGVPAKACGGCHVVKALSQFNKNAKSADGCTSKCRERNRAAIAAWRSENPEYDARYRAENVERRLAYQAQWRATNYEYHREYLARWHAANPGYNAKWRADNPDKKHAQNQRRRAREANVPHEPYSRTEILARYGDTCAYCDAPAEHLDHVHPLSKGGADAPHNLLPACAPCNLSKNAKTLAEWAATF